MKNNREFGRIPHYYDYAANDELYYARVPPLFGGYLWGALIIVSVIVFGLLVASGVIPFSVEPFQRSVAVTN